jgi:hypothetical protein
VKAPAPQAGVSTNSTTWAQFWAAKVKFNFYLNKILSKKIHLDLHGISINIKINQYAFTKR